MSAARMHYPTTVLGFGKYSGKAIEDVLQNDPRYLVWARGEVASRLAVRTPLLRLSPEVHVALDEFVKTPEGNRRCFGIDRKTTKQVASYFPEWADDFVEALAHQGLAVTANPHSPVSDEVDTMATPPEVTTSMQERYGSAWGCF